MGDMSGNTGGARPSGVAAGLAEAETRLCQAWFPPNPQVVAKLQTRFGQGLYRGNPDALISDLKADLSLIALCIRRLSDLASRRDEKYVVPDNPVDLIRAADYEDLRSVLCLREEDLSLHRLMDMSQSQAQVLRQMTISAWAAGEICTSDQLPEDLGYVTAMMRQLGLTLIAWNYPHIYDRARFGLKAGESFETKLTTSLGFSPAGLAITMGRKWRLPPVVRAAVGDTQVAIEDSSLVSMAQQLAHDCRLGESLARAAGGEEAAVGRGVAWEDARNEIIARIGDSGMGVLREKIAAACETYINYASHLFPAPRWETAHTPPENEVGMQLYSRNVHVSECSAQVRKAIERVYRSLDGKVASKEVIRSVGREIIPLAGFPQGCVYIADSTAGALVPRLAIGTAKLSSYKNILYSHGGTHPVVVAFRGNTPVTVENEISEGRKFGYIAGVLGTAQRSGVLYLEIAEALLNQWGSNTQARFKAIQQLICDCLNLY
jgi:hypothetical protein